MTIFAFSRPQVHQIPACEAPEIAVERPMLHSTRFLSVALLVFASPAFASLRPPSPAQAEKEAHEAELKRFGNFPVAANTRAGKNSKSVNTGYKVLNGHLVFDNHAAAVEWMKVRAEENGKGMGAVKFEVLSKHKEQARVQKYVDELWQSTVDLFPEETKGLPFPPVVMIESETSNAFVSDDEDGVAHAVFVLTGLLTEAGGADKKAELTGILAHELAHSVFMHGKPEKSAKIQRYYFPDQAKQGFQSGWDQDLNARMKAYTDAARTAGDIVSADLMDLPAHGYTSPFMTRFWRQMRTALRGTDPACDSEQRTMNAYDASMGFMTLPFAFGILPGKELNLRRVSEDLVRLQSECFVDEKAGFQKIFAATLGISEDNLAGNGAFEKLNAIYKRERGSVSGLRAIVKTERDKMAAVEKWLAGRELGYYTTEQHADDVSALVHANLKRDAGTFSKLLAIMMGNINAADRPACEKAVAQNQIPALGSYFVLHHSYCYRIYNFMRMAEWIGDAKDLRPFAKEFIQRSMRK